MTDSFSIPVRVYYEDTDAGGIVYHVNYMKFMERARTEFLRSTGYDHQKLLQEHKQLVVVDASVQFKQIAQLDDALTVTASIESMGRAKMVFVQQVWRGETLLCTGHFVVACLDSNTRRPTAITESLRNKLSPVTNSS
ncbi:tol-pal system-associated acyl-CoA thioesterase [Endozoicomonas arenosclerae]|uniref:tol-pal system-associated acyl-CoA thioesterase n=1 Tax=Endozoicomonas arenosclerae TaxID=1633495 RepID=UPI000784DD96|nr:tol-pal system-associated acyl-CoA thioesterase [Endozoicomonas arenosclerae]